MQVLVNPFFVHFLPELVALAPPPQFEPAAENHVVDLGVADWVDAEGHAVVVSEEQVLSLDDVFVLAEGVEEVGEGGVVLEVEFTEAIEGVDGVVDGVGGDVALEHETEGGVVGGRGGVGVHAANEVPAELELEELTEDVEHEVEGVSGVMELGVGVFYPVEELEGALPVVVEGEERLPNGGVIGRRCDCGCGCGCG